MTRAVKTGWVWGLAWGMILGLACGAKKVAVTPEESNQAYAAAQAAGSKLAELSPSPTLNDQLQALLKQAEAAQAKKNYDQAKTYAERSRTCAEMALPAYEAYQRLLSQNPPQNLEYQSRVLLRQAEEPLAKQNDAEAKRLFEAARVQAELAFTARTQMIAETRKRLEKCKGELELMYLPSLKLINIYWDAVEKLDPKNKKYDEAKDLVGQLELFSAQEKQMSYVAARVVTVSAPDDDIRRYGWPRMYESVKTDCSLVNVVDTVEPSKQVTYLRTFMCNRQRTFYFVENPRTGKQGWMAERYVASGRAERH